ncbi:hypothetical protein ATK74_1069 [Propionicimonas paludicola]|uniref:Uncharacterized protein n=1 Tax=Propionicimonas paludicola TaxID=185243 RepID=A0A2A9CQ22_9ACTN|nr:hypothetical protein [Propionicimonas paludicola]PFG16524.1 hypothetical protein ATK74_1069 [Propionicimonas paludicola]
MLWVLIFAGIAVAGLIVAISYAVWLWHKASDLFSEVEMLGQRVDELTTLLSQIEPTPAAQLPRHRSDAGDRG